MRNPLLGMGYVNPSVAIIFQIGKIICVHPPHSHATCYNAGNPLRAQWLPLQGTPVARAGGTPLRVRPSGSPVKRARETRLQDWSHQSPGSGNPPKSAGLTAPHWLGKTEEKLLFIVHLWFLSQKQLSYCQSEDNKEFSFFNSH